MTPDQIAQVARAAGFPETSIPIAVAIAMAESSGNPQAHNPRPPDDSYGLWQINMLGALGFARRRMFGLSANTDLYDPLTNAKAAYAISSGGSYWRPWTTFTSGAYKKFLPSSDNTSPGNGTSGGGVSAFLPPALFAPGGPLSAQPPSWVVWAMWGTVAFIILLLLRDRIKGESSYVYR